MNVCELSQSYNATSIIANVSNMSAARTKYLLGYFLCHVNNSWNKYEPVYD